MPHVRSHLPEVAFLRYAHSTIFDAAHLLDRARRDGGKLECRYTPERGTELVLVPPPAPVIPIAPYLVPVPKSASGSRNLARSPRN